MFGYVRVSTQIQAEFGSSIDTQIQLLIDEAKNQLQITRMDLFLLEGNLPAQNCYLNYGFQFVPNDFAITYQNKSYNILKMTIPV